MSDREDVWLLKNDFASLRIGRTGACINDFRMNGSSFNPLSYRCREEDYNTVNPNTACYEGHFSGIGRWGVPSAGEMKAGIANHGDLCSRLWTADRQNDGQLQISAVSEYEGLRAEKTFCMSRHAASYAVTDRVTNIRSTGRLFNMVQHPTLAPPFLSAATRIDSNGTEGFTQPGSCAVPDETLLWPQVYAVDGSVAGLHNLAATGNGIFSFRVDATASIGWLTAYSPDCGLLIGYVWKRCSFPWIHIWVSAGEDGLKAVGLEFGTAPLHLPYDRLVQGPAHIMNEPVMLYLDAGQSFVAGYESFLLPAPDNFNGIKAIVPAGEDYLIYGYDDDFRVHLEQVGIQL